MKRIIRLFVVLLAFGLGSMLPIHPSGPDVSAISGLPYAAAQDPPEGAPKVPVPDAPDIEVEIGGGESTVWYVDPLAIAAALAVLLVVVVLIAMASRGGGTTIIREK